MQEDIKLFFDFIVFFFALFTSVLFVINSIKFFLITMYPEKYKGNVSQNYSELILLISIFLWSIVHVT